MPPQPPQQLNAKESSLFRQVIRCYEDKQYKRGIKAAELILKRHPKHGETMAMKALIMNAQGKSDEAFALGKEALTVDMKSHICWHVYGLLYRHNKNFEEAIKAYNVALKLQPDSAQIRRDLAILQIQMRDYHGYIQTRRDMLQARPQVRASWTALSVAHHLAGQLAEAENVLTTYEGTLKSPPGRLDYENSEAVMYKNSLIAEQGDYARALEHLDAAAKQNLDRVAVLEARALYLAKLERKEEAAAAYRALLSRNPDHIDYYDGLVGALGLKEDDQAGRKAIYDEYAAKFPRSDAARRLPLDFLSGDLFTEAAKAYTTLMLNKGIPSLFANIKHLYSDSAKKEKLVALVKEHLDHATKKSGDAEVAVNGEAEKVDAAALYYLAQHYNYHLSRDLQKAMEYIDKAIELDPTSVDFHMTKARIWKHYGNTQKASETMDHARSLDTRDRYINTKAAKYQLRNNENEKALKTMGLFTRQETVGGPLADLLEMQSLWFLTEDGESYGRQGNIGLALKRFQAVHNIFDVWQEDQFDFHGFSLRKGQIRAYVDMMRWEDRLREHPSYSRVAIEAVSIYRGLADSKANATNGVNGTDSVHGDGELEKKKAAKRAKKEQARLEREAAEKAAKQDPNKAAPKDDPAKKKDDDPLGLKLAATTDPLTDAMKFVTPLLQFSPESLDAQLSGYDIYKRRKKYLLAVQCLNRALALDPTNPKAHSRVVEFQSHMAREVSSLPPKAAEVLKRASTDLPAPKDLGAFNESFATKYKDSAQHQLAAISARRALGQSLDECEKQLIALLKAKDVGFEEAGDALELLQTMSKPATSTPALEAFKAKASERWPEATRF